MEQVLNVWNYLSGKKTLIAGSIAIFAVFLSEVIVGIWEFNPEWMSNAIQTLNWFSIALGGAGILHKTQKSFTNTKTQ